MNEPGLDQFVATLPRYFHGPKARRVVRNLANGGARLRTFMGTDNPHGLAMRQLATIADMFGAKTRTLKTRTSLGMVKA